MVGKWKVKLPHGRWMAGVNRFRTRAKAEEFIDRWNSVESNSGNTTLVFHRLEYFQFEPLL